MDVKALESIQTKAHASFKPSEIIALFFYLHF